MYQRTVLVSKCHCCKSLDQSNIKCAKPALPLPGFVLHLMLSATLWIYRTISQMQMQLRLFAEHIEPEMVNACWMALWSKAVNSFKSFLTIELIEKWRIFYRLPRMMKEKGSLAWSINTLKSTKKSLQTRKNCLNHWQKKKLKKQRSHPSLDKFIGVFHQVQIWKFERIKPTYHQCNHSWPRVIATVVWWSQQNAYISYQ